MFLPFLMLYLASKDVGVLKFCKHTGCRNLVKSGYCDLHKGDEQEKGDFHRGGSSTERGYGARWRRYSKWFLSQPENQFCKLHLDDRCAILAECVDHINPPSGPDDPLFWDTSNHQPACIHCNSVKGHRNLKGNYTFG